MNDCDEEMKLESIVANSASSVESRLEELLAHLQVTLTVASGILDDLETEMPVDLEEREVFAQTHVNLNSLRQLTKKLQSDVEKPSE